jgi:hypothetical protein
VLLHHGCVMSPTRPPAAPWAWGAPLLDAAQRYGWWLARWGPVPTATALLAESGPRGRAACLVAFCGLQQTHVRPNERPPTALAHFLKHP